MISLVTRLVPRPMIMVFGLGMRLHVYMRTTLENGVLRNGQQAQSVMALFRVAFGHLYDRVLLITKALKEEA